MPAYEYRCLDCRKKFEIKISYQEYEKHEVKCPFCQSDRANRIIGKIRLARSSDSRMADLASPENLDHLDDDPKALGRMMRKMSKELGEDMGGEFNEVVSRLEAGQSPDQIEKEVPGLDNNDMGSSSSSSTLDGLDG